VFGVQPLSTEWSATLTPAVQASLDRLTNLVVAQLEAWSESPRATLVHPGR
jgi:hypothetical protein